MPKVAAGVRRVSGWQVGARTAVGRVLQAAHPKGHPANHVQECDCQEPRRIHIHASTGNYYYNTFMNCCRTRTSICST